MEVILCAQDSGTQNIDVNNFICTVDEAADLTQTRSTNYNVKIAIIIYKRKCEITGFIIRITQEGHTKWIQCEIITFYSFMLKKYVLEIL